MKELIIGEQSDLVENLTQLLCSIQMLGGARYSERILSSRDFSLCLYQGGERIFSRKKYKKAISVIVEGRAVAKKTVGGSDVTIRSFTKGDIFGIASLFGDTEEYVSEIYAKENTVVAFISQETVYEIFLICPEAAIAYITLLSQKVRFLNKKLDNFSAPNAYTKLCLYLLENETVNISMQALASSLGMSRMTLYRCLDQLVQNGCICKEGKTIKVLDRDVLADAYASDEIF